MKNKTKIILFVPIFVLALSLSACKEILPISADTFKSTMISMDYIVEDTTDQIEIDNYADIEVMYVASNESIQIGFAVYSSSDMALDTYFSVLEDFEEIETSNNVRTSVSIGNHSKCTLDNGDEYMSQVQKVGVNSLSVFA